MLTNQIQAFLSSDQRILFALSRPTMGLGDFELHIARIEFGRNSFLIFTFPQFDFLTLYCIKLNFGPKFRHWKWKISFAASMRWEAVFLMNEITSISFRGSKTRVKWTWVGRNFCSNRRKICIQPILNRK